MHRVVVREICGHSKVMHETVRKFRIQCTASSLHVEFVCQVGLLSMAKVCFHLELLVMGRVVVVPNVFAFKLVVLLWSL